MRFKLTWRVRIRCGVLVVWCVQCSSGASALDPAERWSFRYGAVCSSFYFC
uniref:Secreted protein n=1 Tax=Setaria viridis TaxID=4556 RepID=A0A4U6VM72_SETVI|nr:hypothetical protein SEVIR_2G063166v2 [Setaria viridis]